MTKLTVTIFADNAAFDEDNLGPELARILDGARARLANVLRGDRLDIALHDINGNRVGSLKLTK